MNALKTELPGFREETATRPRPLLFPEELRTKPQPSYHRAEQPWERTPPANPERALQEIAAKVFSHKDRKQIQALENELGKVDADRKSFVTRKRSMMRCGRCRSSSNFRQRNMLRKAARSSKNGWAFHAGRLHVIVATL